MYLADYHTHSCISPDAKNPMWKMAEAAVSAGLNELCITDHVEPVIWGPGYISCEPTDTFDWEAQGAEFERAKEIIGDRLVLRRGAEMGDAYIAFDRADRIMDAAPELDFVIGSAHMLSQKFKGVDLACFDPKDEQEALEGIADYLDQVEALVKWARFNVLGHLTLPLRYLNGMRGFHLTFDAFEEQIREILKTLIANGCGIELNTNRGGDPLPGEKWLKLYRQLGGEIITLGTDAHTPNFVGCAIRERQELLKACGFTRFCTFEKRSPIWHEL